MSGRGSDFGHSSLTQVTKKNRKETKEKPQTHLFMCELILRDQLQLSDSSKNRQPGTPDGSVHSVTVLWGQLLNNNLNDNNVNKHSTENE